MTAEDRAREKAEKIVARHCIEPISAEEAQILRDMIPDIAAAITEAEEREREACELIAFRARDAHGSPAGKVVAASIAEAIRSRALSNPSPDRR